MDANVYEARLMELKKAFAKVDHRINVFGPDDVTLEDKDTYKDYLEETRKLLLEAQDAAFHLRSELDITSFDDSRNQEIMQLDSNTMFDCFDNARDIKNKMVELIASVPGIDNGTSSATDNEAQSKQLMLREVEKGTRLASEKITKIKVGMKNVTKKYRYLKFEDCQERTVQESKDCKKQLDEMTISKEAIAQDSIGVDVDEHTKNNFKAELHDAIDMGTIKSAAEIKLDNDSKKPTVKSIALILIAVQKFKVLLIKKKIKEGKADIDDQSLNLPPLKCTSFILSPSEPVVKTEADLVKGFRAEGVLTKSNKVMVLTDEDLSASLEYEFKEATEEVIKYNDKKAVDNVGINKDGVLFCKSRLLESKKVHAVGDLEIGVKGVNSDAPVINKLSPIAVSVSLHLHYNVLPHKGAETLYILSLRHAKIILGWTFMIKFPEDDDLKENDAVYFKLTSSALSSEWHIGKIEYVLPSRDMKARKVGIAYKHDTENGSRKMNIVDRPIRQHIKLCDITETPLLDGIAAIRNAGKEIIDDREVVTSKEVEEVITIKDSGDGDESIDNTPSLESIDKASSPEEILETNQKKSYKKRKSGVDKLKIEEWMPPNGKRLRSKTGPTFNLSSVNNANLISKLNVSPSPSLLLNPVTIGYAVNVDTEEKQHEEEGRGDRVTEGLADWSRLLDTTDNCD